MTKLPFFYHRQYFSVLLDSPTLTISGNTTCPEVIFNCNAVELPSTILRWFLNGTEFARYSFNPGDRYPLPVNPLDPDMNAAIGNVVIEILSASQNQASANFLSIMNVNIVALEDARILTVACGSAGTRTPVDLSFNSNRGQFLSV